MNANIRALIRNYFISQILAANTAAGTRVFNSRIDPYMNGPFPSVSVYTVSERPGEVIRMTVPKLREIILEVNVEVVVEVQNATANQPEGLLLTLTSPYDYALTLDTICQQIQDSIGYNLNKLVDDCYYAGTTITYLDKGESTLAIAKMQFDASYPESEGQIVDPSTLPDLKTIDNKWDMANITITGDPGPDGQIDAEDLLKTQAGLTGHSVGFLLTLTQS